MKIIDC